MDDETVSGWLRIGRRPWVLVAEGKETDVRAALQAEAAELAHCDTLVTIPAVNPNGRKKAKA